MRKILIQLALLLLAAGAAYARYCYELTHPLVERGRRARIVAIPSTGKDIRSPVSFLFGRAPYFILCDRFAQTYKSLPNPFLDAAHASGLKLSRLLIDKGVDAVCANNIGFEPIKTFNDARIEVYTGINGTVWDTLNRYPESLDITTTQNVPSHFGITNSKTPIACSSFNARANIENIVQASFFVCVKCSYRLPTSKAQTLCPNCGGAMSEIYAVLVPPTQGGVKPRMMIY
ncbi:MAG: NifB/NifX family molybdenum-iron cluster-binding protein [Planctomycetes bacterium]|nr:NifB/NifX family molybdenum-iron cluster-binding protein [Planctomycetota bacterium]